MKKSITVLGAGAWGTAMAHLLATNGHDVTMWCHEKEVADAINLHLCNKLFLPDACVPEGVSATTSLEEALKKSDWVFEAVPVKFLRAVLEQAKPFLTSEKKLVLLSKGIENETLMLPSQIVRDVLGERKNVAVLGGPNFAKDLVSKAMTATALAAESTVLLDQLEQLLKNNYFKPYLSTDLLGVQVGGALKNVITLAIGIAKGQNAADNTIAFLLTRGLHEISLIAQKIGGEQSTLYGLSGLGDLALTSLGASSKNLALGIKLGRGASLEELSETMVLPEGVNTIQSVKKLMDRHGLELPIISGTYKIIFEGDSFEQLLDGVVRG